MPRRVSRAVSLLLAGALLLAGCGDGRPAVQSRDEITVFAATSLTGAFSEIGQSFEHANPGAKVTFNFGGSSALAQQIAEGAPADVFASADTKHLKTGAVFARNRLVIVTKPGNPEKIRALADLTDTGVVALCGAEVPCGAYATQALAKAGVVIPESRVTRGQNVAAALSAVREGDAAAGIVYVTDAKTTGSRVTTVAIPDAHNVLASYPIALVPATKHAATARAFMAYVRSAAGQRVLRSYGFLAP